jgi:cysteine desulfurase/selenocysteine lyase
MMNRHSSLAAAPLAMSRPNFDAARIREDFPIFRQKIYGKPLTFLDSAASAQKPRQVLDAMQTLYEQEYANIHRGVYWLSQRATDRFEGARATVARFVNAPGADNIVFTRNATEAINLVAASYGRSFLKEGDEVVLSQLEHHANIVPWQLLRSEKGTVIKVAPIDDDGNFLLDEYRRLLGPRTRIVAVTHVSNAIGTVTPIREIIRLAHEAGAVVLVDGSQSAPHRRIDVQELDADFYVFTGHKLYGPSGIGALYGKADLLAAMPPYQGGGDMIANVTFEETTFKPPPHRFEAGTPAIVEAAGLGAAVDYVESLGFENIQAHEHDLLVYATERLSEIPGLRIIGRAAEKASIISFTLESAHPHDIGTILDRAGVAVRAGHHCVQPLMDRFGLPATVRASFGVYNTREDADALVAAVRQVQEIFG